MTDIAFTPNPSKIEHERLVMDFEENCPDGLRMEVDEYRALLILLNYVAVKGFPDGEVSDAWHYLIEWVDA